MERKTGRCGDCIFAGSAAPGELCSRAGCSCQLPGGVWGVVGSCTAGTGTAGTGQPLSQARERLPTSSSVEFFFPLLRTVGKCPFPSGRWDTVAAESGSEERGSEVLSQSPHLLPWPPWPHPSPYSS